MEDCMAKIEDRVAKIEDKIPDVVDVRIQASLKPVLERFLQMQLLLMQQSRQRLLSVPDRKERERTQNFSWWI